MATRPFSARSPVGDAELVQGLRAGLAVYARRPGDVLRVAYAHAVRSDLQRLSRWAESKGTDASSAAS